MGGGLMQLVAYGAQDVYLSGNPQITFFKVVYRRHTNFAVEPVQQTWNGAADFGRTVTCNINRNGDLITNMYLAVKLAAAPANSVAWGYVRRLGHALVEDVKVEIGGSKIDEHYGDWLNVWYELTHKVGQERGYAQMIGDVPNLTNVSTNAKLGQQLYVPMIFWFNRNNGLALPLIALQYHDVRMTLKYRDLSQCINYLGTSAPVLSSLMADSYLLIDYVYLDAEERKRFAQASHEYLIEQLQFTGAESLTSQSNKYRLNFNHPCKYLVWTPHLDRHMNRNSWVSYAVDNKWHEAKDKFAKIVSLACAQGLAIAGNTVRANSSSGNNTVVGDVVDLTSVAHGGVSADLLSRMEVKFVAQSAGATLTIVATGNSQAELVNQLLGNMIVVRNELTMEDISKTVAELVSSGANAASAAAQQLYGLFSMSVVSPFNYGNFVDGTDNPVVNAKLQLNGHDRFQARDGSYFNYVQPWQHFSNTPADGINVYSFALRAEDHQPTGTCNFSRIDNATLLVDVGKNNATDSSYVANFVGNNSSSTLNIWTVNYNVLRVMSGMAGTAYSN
jgi:hypothetical protein